VNATAIIPVKRFGAAKRRLLDAIDPPARAAIVKAMLADVLTATTACDAVERVIVVTGEGRAEKVALATSQRVRTPIEVMRDPDDAGHPEAATLGIVRAKALGAECALLLPGDCPLLDSAELHAALDRAAPGRVTVVPDRHGTGTNALILSPPDAIAPGFGAGSRERHVERAERRGLEAAVEELDSLALDLDTPDDLRELAEVLAAEPQRAPTTAAELARLGLP
jgi:2-phospho-L-lactate/phosphoenolpyruvate guanylyltransferase